MKIGIVVLGGVDRSGEYRVVPCLLWFLERVARVHDVHVFALQQEPRRSRYELRGARVHNAGLRPRRLRTLAAILHEHRQAPFGLLHAFWAVPSGVVAALAGRLLQRPVLLHLGGGELVALPDIAYGERRTRRGRIWTDLALRGATRITAASDTMREQTAALGYDAQLVTLGVDLEAWPSAPVRRRDPGAPARLLHVGSINRVKDQGTLFRAAAALRDHGVAFCLDVVGEDTLRGEMQLMTRTLGISDRVRFHGFLPHRQLRPLVDRADLLLVSSRHEAGPLALLEAAVAGVPTVGTAVGHIRDWAPDAAVAVPPEDYRALAAETAALLADEGRRQRLALAAQARAIEEDADRTAERFLDIYRDVA